MSAGMHWGQRLGPGLSCAALGLLAACCGGSSGELRGVEPALNFVSSSEEILAVSQGAWVRLKLTGQGEAPLARPGLHLRDASPGLETLVLSDADTNLWVVRGGEPAARVSALDSRLSEVALSPDGRTIAATRHANYDLPQSGWDAEEDDAVWLVDVASLEVTTLPASAPGRVARLRWTEDGAAVVLSDMQGQRSRVSLPDGARAPWLAEDDAGLRPLFPPAPTPRCEATGAVIEELGWRGDAGLAVVQPDGSRAPLVTVTGRERGFHDYLPTISDYFFSQDCAYAIFVYGHEGLYIVHVASGRVAKLASASSPRPLPR